jgi:hypothetical protein
MRPDRFPIVNDVMLAEAIRQILPLAKEAAGLFNERWAVSSVQRADILLNMWVRQGRGRKKQLGGPLPEPAKGFWNVTDNPDHPDPGQSVPPECQSPSRNTKRPQNRSTDTPTSG